MFSFFFIFCKNGVYCGFRFCCDFVEIMLKFNVFFCFLVCVGFNRVLRLNMLVKVSEVIILVFICFF